MKAVVSITIDEEFVVHDIKVIEGEKGLFIAMPSRKATDVYKRQPAFYGEFHEMRGVFLQKHSCDLPKLFHGILCLNLFYNHVFIIFLDSGKS